MKPVAVGEHLDCFFTIVSLTSHYTASIMCAEANTTKRRLRETRMFYLPFSIPSRADVDHRFTNGLKTPALRVGPTQDYHFEARDRNDDNPL